MDKLIYPLSELGKNSIPVAGGKGASLGELLKMGMLVPPGFVVSAKCFERFLQETDINVEIRAMWKRINIEDMESVEENSEILRDVITQKQLPEALGKSILVAFDSLRSKEVAVRSSATAEDSKIDSWAGELESYLNTQKKDLFENIKKCWASLYTPRAMVYRAERNLIDTQVSVAVVIQKMIQSEVSGVCFTVHPITKDKNQMVIEAVWGLGEALVQGRVTPDTYVIEKDTLRILDTNRNPQRKMYALLRGKTRVVNVPAFQKKAQKLSEKQIQNLARLCISIEKHYRIPQDIEWARHGNTFFVLQSRPITTL